MSRVTVPVEVIELGDLAASKDPSPTPLSFTPAEVAVVGPVRLVAGVHHWRLMLLFADADDPSYLVIGAYADFLTVNVSAPDLAESLRLAVVCTGYLRSADAFAEFVADPTDLAVELRRAGAVDDPEVMVAILGVVVDPCFRGRDFSLLLLWELYEVTRALVDAANIPAPAVVGCVAEDVPAQVVAHWRTELNATSTRGGLLILPADIIPLSTTSLIAEHQSAGYITVDVNALRQRLADGDASLHPREDGHHPNEMPDGDDAHIAEEQAVDAVELAVEANVFDENLHAEVLTAVKFFACTGDDDDEASTPFARAAAFLDEHPDVSVVAANWSAGLCESGGEHLLLELTIRRGAGNSGNPW
jgi:hypothetical protein